MKIAAVVAFPAEAQTVGCVARHSVQDATLPDDDGTVIVAPSDGFSETIASESLETVDAGDGSTIALHVVVEGTKARRSPVPTRPVRAKEMVLPGETAPTSAFLIDICGNPALGLANMVTVVDWNERAADALKRNMGMAPMGAES